MMAQRILGILLIWGFCVPRSDELTTEEISKFRTSNTTERNTGKVGWVKVESIGAQHIITSNGIPDHQTGMFPGKGNPNAIKETNFRLEIPSNPTVAREASCLPMGPIAVAINGVAIFNPYNSDGFNAVEGPTAERFDSCNGHPQQKGMYHYHQKPNCIPNVDTRDQIIGVANDGFPIYGPVDVDNKVLTSADLDKCHGRFVNGKYRYHVTSGFPYIMGCFMGTPTSTKAHRDKCFFMSAASSLGLGYIPSVGIVWYVAVAL